MQQFPRFAVQNSVDRIQCRACHGKGYGSVQGFDGNERVTCTECKGYGGWEWVEPVEVDVALDAELTVSDVERHINPTPIAIDHPNMTPIWFDRAVKRAFDAELSISRTSRASVGAVSSSADADISYLVTRETCECRGHQSAGRCYHRAFAIFFWWVRSFDVVTVPVEVEELIAA